MLTLPKKQELQNISQPKNHPSIDLTCAKLPINSRLSKEITLKNIKYKNFPRKNLERNENIINFASVKVNKVCMQAIGAHYKYDKIAGGNVGDISGKAPLPADQNSIRGTTA